jgi:hypothetical protein
LGSPGSGLGEHARHLAPPRRALDVGQRGQRRLGAQHAGDDRDHEQVLEDERGHQADRRAEQHRGDEGDHGGDGEEPLAVPTAHALMSGRCVGGTLSRYPTSSGECSK